MTREILGYLKTRIGRRFLVVFLVISLLPLLIMRWLAIQRSEAAIHEQTLTILRTASDGAEGQLREFIEHLKERLVQISRDERVRRALRIQSTAKILVGDSRNANILDLRQEMPSDAEELFLITAHGGVLLSTSTQNVGADLSTNEYFLRGSESFFAGDISANSISREPKWVMTAPVTDPANDKLLGVAAFRINPRVLSALTSGRRVLSKGSDTQSFRIGETGETYIVNSDGLMITESRYKTNSFLKLKVDTLPVHVALDRGQEVTASYKDYRGVDVSGSSVVLRDPPWILITEIDFRQAFAPIQHLQNELIAATIGLIVLAILFAWSCTWRVVKPIRLLGESDYALARQDEAAAFVPEVGLPNDEVGELVRTRNARVRAVFEYQRQLEERTRKLQEMVSEIEHISYAIVHDMRAPLRAMQGFASLLEADDGDQGPAERKGYLRNISGAAIRLDHLIQDVLTYNRTVLRQAPLHWVDLASLLRGMLDTYPNLGPEKADINIEGPLPAVVGNEALLTQCFSNLLDNAVKFVPAGTRPKVRVWSEILAARPEHKNDESHQISLPITNREDSRKSTPRRYERIWIEDNGVGIPQDAQDKIFRMFQRLTHDPRGTGIGLAIVHKVIQQMDGTIGVESAPGKGSRFWIELPTVDSSQKDFT